MQDTIINVVCSNRKYYLDFRFVFFHASDCLSCAEGICVGYVISGDNRLTRGYQDVNYIYVIFCCFNVIEFRKHPVTNSTYINWYIDF